MREGPVISLKWLTTGVIHLYLNMGAIILQNGIYHGIYVIDLLGLSKHYFYLANLRTHQASLLLTCGPYFIWTKSVEMNIDLSGFSLT